MAGEQQPIIIKKKKGGGGHGHHGGAWKVAYADFVTAMMCFFLVMWLMGSDEETKAAVAHYFNHPNTPYKDGKDPHSTSVHPMGEKEGSGDSTMNGMDGFYPEDLIERPRPLRDVMKENRTLSLLIEDLLEGQVYGMDVNQERVKFSLSEQVLFDAGSSQLLTEGKKKLDLLGQVLKGFKGFITIEGHTDNVPVQGVQHSNNWQLSLARAVSVMDYFVQKHGFDERLVTPVGRGPRRAFASNKDLEGRKKNRRVEFILSYDRPE
ncbi:MAG: flagellar motor protein MotB [Bdellovibrionota bacterium]